MTPLFLDYFAAPLFATTIVKDNRLPIKYVEYNKSIILMKYRTPFEASKSTIYVFDIHFLLMIQYLIDWFRLKYRLL